MHCNLRKQKKHCHHFDKTHVAFIFLCFLPLACVFIKKTKKQNKKTFTFLTSEYGGPCLAISVTFQNCQSDIHTLIGQMCGVLTCLFFSPLCFFFYSWCNYFFHFSYEQLKATSQMSSNRNCLKMCAFTPVFKHYYISPLRNNYGFLIW